MKQGQRAFNQVWRLWIVLFLVSATSLLLPQNAYADDCLDDPLNAADCMRTPGFREGITVVLGVTATTGVVLTNIIAQSVLPGTKPVQTPAKPPVRQPNVPVQPKQPAQVQNRQPAPPKRISPEAPQQPPPEQDSSFFTFDNLKRLVDYPGKITQVLEKFKFGPDAVKNWQKAWSAWHLNPNKASAQNYIDATRQRMNPTGRTGKYLDRAGKVLDVVDAAFKAEEVIQKRGYKGWEKAGAYYVEGANKVIVTVLTKNPVVGLVDQVVGDLTGHNIESTIRAGEEKWAEVTEEYFNNTFDVEAKDAEINTKDEGIRHIRHIRELMDKGKISREEGSRRAKSIFNKMVH